MFDESLPAVEEHADDRLVVGRGLADRGVERRHVERDGAAAVPTEPDTTDAVRKNWRRVALSFVMIVFPLYFWIR
jgi:hypothetical protein